MVDIALSSLGFIFAVILLLIVSVVVKAHMLKQYLR